VKNKTLVNTETSKEIRFFYDKRMIIPEKDGAIETLPWGYSTFSTATVDMHGADKIFHGAPASPRIGP
jgi:hypothetical protein